MQKMIASLLLCCMFSSSFAQKQRKVSTYLTTQFNTTLYDITKGNNPWAVGFGLQAFLNNTTRFKPTIELTGDIYLADDKVLRLDKNGNAINSVGGMVNLFAGASYSPIKPVSFFITGRSKFFRWPNKAGHKTFHWFLLSKVSKMGCKTFLHQYF